MTNTKRATRIGGATRGRWTLAERGEGRVTKRRRPITKERAGAGRRKSDTRSGKFRRCASRISPGAARARFPPASALHRRSAARPILYLLATGEYAHAPLVALSPLATGRRFCPWTCAFLLPAALTAGRRYFDGQELAGGAEPRLSVILSRINHRRRLAGSSSVLYAVSTIFLLYLVQLDL